MSTYSGSRQLDSMLNYVEHMTKTVLDQQVTGPETILNEQATDDSEEVITHCFK